MGLIGGGVGSLIGPVHRIAAELDGRIALVAGTFSSDPRRSVQSGESYGVDPARAYASVDAMLAGEAGRPDGIELVAIATPNHLHLSAAEAALAAGLAVISEKPATATLAEAEALSRSVQRSGRPYALAYTYTGFPMVREARRQVAAGAIGRVRKVVVEFSQGWLAVAMEALGSKQAGWRVDPEKSGIGGCIADLGTHAFNLAEFVTGDQVLEVMADLGSVVEGRRLDDDAAVLLRFSNGARGVLIASQIATGEASSVQLKVYGDAGALSWDLKTPDQLLLSRLDGATEVLVEDTEKLARTAERAAGLPGAFAPLILAFADIYRDFADVLVGDGDGTYLQGVDAGLRGMAFVERSVLASREQHGWTELSV
jgi:predicted dehydrogenase